MCGNPVLYFVKDISFNHQRYIFEKPFLYLWTFKHIGMETGPEPNSIRIKRKTCLKKSGTVWTGSIYFLVNKYIHFRQKVLINGSDWIWFKTAQIKGNSSPTFSLSERESLRCIKPPQRNATLLRWKTRWVSRLRLSVT